MGGVSAALNAQKLAQWIEQSRSLVVLNAQKLAQWVERSRSLVVLNAQKLAHSVG